MKLYRSTCLVSYSVCLCGYRYEELSSREIVHTLGMFCLFDIGKKKPLFLINSFTCMYQVRELGSAIMQHTRSLGPSFKNPTVAALGLEPPDHLINNPEP